jgi:pimeloyl-ACP methyl ester carboxylesterase
MTARPAAVTADSAEPEPEPTPTPTPTPRRKRRRLRKVVLAIVGTLLVLIGITSTYQAIASSRDAERFSAPGQLIDIGSHKMHLNCTGTGSPTVLLDHASGSLSAQWGLVQPKLAQVTRTCSYDRSGYGWSEDSPDGNDALTQASELDTLLQVAGETGPYVHVGHSSGAFISAIFASKHPNETAGVVMVEPGYVWGTPGMPADLDADVRSQESALANINLWLARSGIGRLLGPVIMGGNDLPSAQQDPFDALALSTRQFHTFKAEIESGEATATAVLAARQDLRSTPLIVLSAMPEADDRMGQEMRATHQRLAESSTRGMHIDVENTDHMGIVLQEDAAAIVTDQIIGLIEETRG